MSKDRAATEANGDCQLRFFKTHEPSRPVGCSS